MARRSSLLRVAGRYETEGRRLLVKLLNTTLRTEVASFCGVSDAAVGMWATGAARPDLDTALMLEQRFGIAMRTWATAPTFTNPICSEGATLSELNAAPAAE